MDVRVVHHLLQDDAIFPGSVRRFPEGVLKSPEKNCRPSALTSADWRRAKVSQALLGSECLRICAGVKIAIDRRFLPRMCVGPRPFVSDIAVRTGKTIVRQHANLVRPIWRYEMDARIKA
jgi:hypothetical protein